MQDVNVKDTPGNQAGVVTRCNRSTNDAPIINYGTKLPPMADRLGDQRPQVSGLLLIASLHCGKQCRQAPVRLNNLQAKVMGS